MSAQNGLVKKLADILLNNEQDILNQRFTFYKMIHRDSFGNSLVAKHGPNYEALNRCMLSDTIDALNVEVRNIQGNVAASDPLLSALAQIKQAYEYHMQKSDKLDFDAPLREAFELDRMSYAKQIQILTECI